MAIAVDVRKSNKVAHAIAFYLPQFHPITENDAWWGKGFTEWTNAARCQPRFSGHQQPHLPADLGFYDLRLPEVRAAQAELARNYGIHGFCYYHYWFDGRRILERPFNEVLESREPKFPFCLCWANENWTRSWDGQEQAVLLRQSYQVDDDRRHIQSLASAFTDDRYIRIDGKPMFLVYRASAIPNADRTTEIWREEARKLGLGELYLCRVESFASERADPQSIGFDASVEFAPDWDCLGTLIKHRRRDRWLARIDFRRRAFTRNRVSRYEDLVARMRAKATPSYKQYRCVTPMWDNSARRADNATVLVGSTPKLYESWLSSVVAETATNTENPLVFINAWNEWAEGNHLEPCQRWGHAYLEATRNALEIRAVS